MASTDISGAHSGSDSLPLRLQHHARVRGERLAAAFLGDDVAVQASWSVGELDVRARTVGAYLQQQGLTNQTVVLAYPSGLEFIAAFCGCLYAGAIAVPAPLPRAHGTDERLATILADSGARVALTDERHLAPVARHSATSGAVTDVAATDVLVTPADDYVAVAPDADRLAFLQYTSGSTRSPSGVMITLGNMTANLESLRLMLRLHEGSVGVSWLPQFHDMGLIAGTLLPLWTGYPAYLMAPGTFIQNPLRWWRACARFRGTITSGPNFAYQSSVDAARNADLRDLDLSAVEIAGNGAEPVRASTVAQFVETFGPAGFRPGSLTPSFGLAEATLLVTSNNGTVPPVCTHVDEQALRNGHVTVLAHDDPGAKALVGSGRAAPGTVLRIVRPDTKTDLDPDEVGEIWVCSASVGRGYWRKPEESRAVFEARLNTGEGPFLRTGDLGFMRDGELFVTGRLKDVIVIRGANYYPQDLERTVEASHPALRGDAGAVVGVDTQGRVQLVVVQEIRREHWRTVDADEVFLAIRRSVAREHQLALDGIALLRPFGLPKTSSGKVQRARCRAALLDGGLPVLHEWRASASAVAPIDFTGEPLTQPGVLERQLVDWLKRECALPELTWKTPFMEMGIDSLKGVELGNALSTSFNHSFSTTLLIDHPNVESLATLIRQQVLCVPTPAPVVPMPAIPAVTRPPLGADEIASLDSDELDDLLQQSIDAVLKRGDQA